MFKQFRKQTLVLCLLLLTQIFVVSVSTAQDSGIDAAPEPDVEYLLKPASASRVDPHQNQTNGTTAVTDSLPLTFDIDTRRNAGSQLLTGLQTAEITDLAIEATNLVPARLENLSLSQDPTSDDPFDNLAEGTTFFTTVEVPDDAVRLVAEIIEATAVDVQLYVGEGRTPDATTLVCSSVGDTAVEYCNIPAPEAGAWWILVQNVTASAAPPDSITLAHAVVAQNQRWCHHWNDDCFEAILKCLQYGLNDDCLEALADCFPDGLDDSLLTELLACFFYGPDDDCLDVLADLDCFPDDLDDAFLAELQACFNDGLDYDCLHETFDHYWPDDDHDGFDDDCDEDDDEDDDDDREECVCDDTSHQYNNHHEDDHHRHHERCRLPQNVNMWVEGPATVPAMTPFDLRVFWDESAMVAGDYWYAAFTVGSNPTQPGDLGTVYVDLERHDDDVVKTVSAATAVPGDTLTYTITIQPDVTPEALTYAITDTIPTGLTYVPGSATANNGTVTVAGNVLTWTGTAVAPGFTYHVDTSLTNPACTAPIAERDGVADAYLDMSVLGIVPDPNIYGDNAQFDVDFAGGAFEFFGAPQGEIINFTDDGFAFFSPSTPGPTPQLNQPIPTASEPNNLLAVFWRDMEIVYDGVSGVSFANLTDAVTNENLAGIIEFDDVQNAPASPGGPSYDFEIIAYYQADPARYEYIFAYNNLTGPVTNGTIGLENDTGTDGVQYGFNDLVLTDGMAICFDQVGSGDTAVQISYQVTVDDDAFGLLTNHVAHNTDNPGSKEAYTSAAVRIGGASLYLSSSSSGLAGDVGYSDEDIIRYALDSGAWSLYFDGSDVGLKGIDVNALHVMDDGSILLSFAHKIILDGVGKVRSHDIVRFIPTATGEDTAGSFEMYFDGSDYGLRRYGEGVDAIAFTPDGRLAVSTRSAFKVPRVGGGKLRGADDDLIALNASGGWEMYLDGSDLWRYREDVWGAWIQADTGEIYLSMQNEFTAGTVSGDQLDIFICHPESLGADSACTFSMYFDGSVEGFGGNRIDGFAIGR